MATEFTDLLMDNGELVRIEYNDKYMDEFWGNLDNCIKRKDTWSVNTLDGTKASYMGISIERVNTGKVIGVL